MRQLEDILAIGPITRYWPSNPELRLDPLVTHNPPSEANDAVAMHDKIASSFDQSYQRSGAFKERYDKLGKIIRSVVKPGDAVLDAGCGAGQFSFMAADLGADVTAIDGSQAMIDICKQRQTPAYSKTTQFEVAMLQSLENWPGNEFDVIISSSVLEYVPNLDAILANFSRILKPNGVLIASLPNAQSRYRKWERRIFNLTGRPRYFGHVQHMSTPNDMTRDLNRHAITVNDACYFGDPPLFFPGWTFLRETEIKTLFAVVGRKLAYTKVR